MGLIHLPLEYFLVHSKEKVAKIYFHTYAWHTYTLCNIHFHVYWHIKMCSEYISHCKIHHLAVGKHHKKCHLCSIVAFCVVSTGAQHCVVLLCCAWRPTHAVCVAEGGTPVKQDQMCFDHSSSQERVTALVLPPAAHHPFSTRDIITLSDLPAQLHL